MLFFAALIPAQAGNSPGMQVLGSSNGVLNRLPLWQIVNGAVEQ